MNIDDNISSKLLGDITKIQKILLNIITNACKYSEIGKIILTVSATNDKEIQTLHFKISDTGCGIKKEELQFIFDGEQESSGLGLALSKKYIDVMNATVKVESVYGAGTVFYLDIPQKIVGTRLISEDRKNDTSDEIVGFIDCSKYKVLICDDDILDIKVTKKLLEKYKFQITTISSTIECIDRIKGEEVYDILFLDHKMPDIDGVQAMKILKSLDEYNIPKIVALTANAVTGAREYYLREGFDDYLSKPINMHELDKIIKRNFNK
jgi:CheY-like chemotaxis protein